MVTVLADKIARWGITGGEPAVSPNGFEDGEDFLVVWGAREYIVDGDNNFILLNGTVTFVNRETGLIRDELMVEQFAKVDGMTPVSVL